MIKSETSLVIKCSVAIVQTYTKILTLCYDLDLAHNNQTFRQAPPEQDKVASNYAWFSIKLCLVASAATILVIKAIWHWLTMMYHHTNFGYQGQSSSEDIWARPRLADTRMGI